MKRTINTRDVFDSAVRLLYRANFTLPDGVGEALGALREGETGETAAMALDVIAENARIAASDELPLCQDCGSVIFFVEMGQDVCLEGGPIRQELDRAVEEAYRRYYLRKSIVRDPLRRENTGTNAPCSVHADIVAGASFRLTAYLKGGGSENMTRLAMMRPTAPVEEIIEFTVRSVIDAGPNPCPPLFLGMGIGGTADAAMLNAKKAVLRHPASPHPDPFYRDLELEIGRRLNATGVGPMGFGGTSTAARVFILPEATHIATLPVALNMNCHSLRYAMEEL